VKSLALYERSGTEKKWKEIGRSTKQNGTFEFMAPGDGAYQFIVFADGKDEDLPERKWKPSITVVVDTIRPFIEAKLQNRDNGSVVLNWKIEESHPDLKTLHAEYRLEGEKEWRKLAISPNLEGAEAFSGLGKVAEVRLRMKDKAGNEGETVAKR